MSAAPHPSPSYSLCSTVYNDIHSIDAHLRSLAPQLTPEFEWVIVDPGSTDGTEVVLERFARSYENVLLYRYVRRNTVLARGPARRMAASHARAPVLVSSIDADIVYRPGALEAIVQEFHRGSEVATAGDGFFICKAEDYWKAGGHHPALQVEEDWKLYDAMVERGIPFRTVRLNAWAEDRRETDPRRNLAPMGSKEDKTEPLALEEAPA